MAEYVIDKEYCFELVADGPRPSCVGGASIKVQLTHDEVMEMGADFKKEYPNAMWENDYGLKEKLDEAAAKEMAQELFEEWQSEHENGDEDEFDEDRDDDDGEKTVEDFYEQAWENLGDCYFCWDQDLVEKCIDYYNEHIKPSEEVREKIAKSAISNVSDFSFSCRVYAGEGGTCGDSWGDCVDLELERPELLYLINESTDIKDLLQEDEEMKKIDVDSIISDMASDAAFPDGVDDEFENWSCGGECESLEGYIQAWSDLLSLIYEGEIAEDELEEWLEYFDDEENFGMEIEEWHNEIDDF